MTANLRKFNTLIFDLGGVIINLEIQRTIQALSELSGLSSEMIIELYWHHEQFHAYEKGHIDDKDFRNFVRELLKINASDLEIDAAWNAMILDIPKERLHLLQRLGQRYQLFLLSNTNNIHLKYVQQVYNPLRSEMLDDHFQKAYYSHHVGMRKPDSEIYEYVLEENSLHPEHTLFLDDNKHNIAGASSVGLKTFLVENPDQIISLFNE